MPVPVPDGCEELPELVLVNEPDVVLVEAAERVPDHLLGIRALRVIPHIEPWPSAPVADPDQGSGVIFDAWIRDSE
jgi:hypothetical protein